MADEIGRAFIAVDPALWDTLGIPEGTPDYFQRVCDKLLLAGVVREDSRVVVMVEGRGIPMNADGTVREAVVTYGHDPARDVHWLKGVRIMCPNRPVYVGNSGLDRGTAEAKQG